MSYLLKGTIAQLAQLSADQLVATMLNNSDVTHSLAEQNSWRNSLYRLIQLLRDSLSELVLVAEYGLLNQRIDVLLFGQSQQTGQLLTTIVELKQWTDLGENSENKITEVNVRIGAEYEYRIHPVFQTHRYRQQLHHHHSFFQAHAHLKIETMQYLDNFTGDSSAFFTGCYHEYHKKYFLDRLFIHNEQEKLIQLLKESYTTTPISADISMQIDEFLQGNYVIGEVGLQGFREVLQGKTNAIMLDDQNEITAQVYQLIEQFKAHPQHTAIIIQGAAGTGKTIIGLHLLYKAIEQQMCSANQVVLTFAKSRTLKAVLEGESEIEIPYLDYVNPEKYQMVVVDEAHRMPNVDEVVQQLFHPQNRPIMVVFLLDEYQRILPDEQGTIAAFRQPLAMQHITPHLFELKSQKRSGWQRTYVQQIQSLLFGRIAPLTEPSDFQITIASRLAEIETALQIKHQQGNTVKWFAPYCWAWRSRNTRTAQDIVIAEEQFHKQWNPFAPEQQYDWYKCVDEQHFHQVGSVYSAQGLDYDYQGFIWWSDLKWNSRTQQWEYDLSQSEDASFKKSCETYLSQHQHSAEAQAYILQLVLNQYYVLLTRARKGVYIWFKNQETAAYVRSQLLTSE